jgi:hypothetical protein
MYTEQMVKAGMLDKEVFVVSTEYVKELETLAKKLATEKSRYCLYKDCDWCVKETNCECVVVKLIKLIGKF